VWTTPKNFQTQGSRIQKTQGLNTQESLREEPRSRAAVGVGTVDPAGVELNLAAVEVEDRRERKHALDIRLELIAGAVDVEVIVVVQAFGMRQQHDADGERPEAELVEAEDLAGTANRATAMTESELRSDDQDVRVALGFRERDEELLGLGRLAEVIAIELAVAVVVELAATGLLDRVEHLLQDESVSAAEQAESLHTSPNVGNGEPAFCAVGKHGFALLDLREQILIGIADARKEFAQTIALLGQTLGLVAGQVAVGGLHLFALVLVGDRHVREGEDSGFTNADSEVRIGEDALGAVFADIASLEVIRHRLVGGVGRDAGDLLDLTVGDFFLSNRRHDVISVSESSDLRLSPMRRVMYGLL
jgi:hypothetical protein